MIFHNLLSFLCRDWHSSMWFYSTPFDEVVKVSNYCCCSVKRPRPDQFFFFAVFCLFFDFLLAFSSLSVRILSSAERSLMTSCGDGKMIMLLMHMNIKITTPLVPPRTLRYNNKGFTTNFKVNVYVTVHNFVTVFVNILQTTNKYPFMCEAFAEISLKMVKVCIFLKNKEKHRHR